MIVWNHRKRGTSRDYVSGCGRFRIHNRVYAVGGKSDWVLYDGGRLVTRCRYARGWMLAEIKRIAERRLRRAPAATV